MFQSLQEQFQIEMTIISAKKISIKDTDFHWNFKIILDLITSLDTDESFNLFENPFHIVCLPRTNKLIEFRHSVRTLSTAILPQQWEKFPTLSYFKQCLKQFESFSKKIKGIQDQITVCELVWNTNALQSQKRSESECLCVCGEGGVSGNIFDVLHFKEYGVIEV